MGKDRDFKGIWIPKEIWLSKDLTMQEKIFLVEIDSLDNKDGCYASNKYFSEFFCLSKGRCSQIINSLIEKDFITAKYERKESGEVGKRVLNISKGVFNILKGGIKYPKGGYLENDKENNTSNNNTSNNNSVITLVNDVPSASDSNTWESAIRVSNRLLESIQQWDNTHRYNSNPPSIESWVKDIDRAIRLDGRTEEQLNWVIDFLFTKNHRISNFWASNIQSGKKLREQFDKIKNQIKSEKYGTNKPIQQSIAETEDFLNRYSGQQGT